MFNLRSPSSLDIRRNIRGNEHSAVKRFDDDPIFIDFLRITWGICESIEFKSDSECRSGGNCCSLCTEFRRTTLNALLKIDYCCPCMCSRWLHNSNQTENVRSSNKNVWICSNYAQPFVCRRFCLVTSISSTEISICWFLCTLSTGHLANCCSVSGFAHVKLPAYMRWLADFFYFTSDENLLEILTLIALPPALYQWKSFNRFLSHFMINVYIVGLLFTFYLEKNVKGKI